MASSASIEDCTAGKQAAPAQIGADRKQKMLLAILEATSDMIGLADARGDALYLNQAAQKALEIPPEECDRFHVSEVLPPEQQRIFETVSLPQAIAEGSWTGESILQTRSGKTIPISQTLVAHRDASGEVEYLSAIMRDISDRKAAEAYLRDREQFLQSIYDGADIVIFAWDLVDPDNNGSSSRRWVCAGWNYCCEQATGMSAQQVLGKTPAEIFGPEQGAQVVGNCNQCACQHQPIAYEEKIVIDGSPTWWATKLNPIQDKKGQVYRVVGTTISITELKLNAAELETYGERQAQQAQALTAALNELKRTQAQVLQSEKMSSLGQMVAGIAHEINNPVNFIHANVKPARNYALDLLEIVQMYQQECPHPSETLSEYLEEIDLDFVKKDFLLLLESMTIGTQRIREIVLSLRNFSRLDEAEVKAVDLKEGIESTLVILAHKLKQGENGVPIEVARDYDGQLPPVECYPSQLNQVLMNILANAIDALAETERPQIRLSTAANRDWAAITIADNGPGMPPAVRERIFDPFFTTKPVGKGTGMGLSISYQIVVDRHSGRLSVSSAPGQGTEFTIEIPLKQKAYS